MEKENIVPLFSSLSMVICPPMRSTSCFEILSPNPVPPYFLETDASTCEKLLKSLSSSDFAIPIPVSSTIKKSSILFFSWAVIKASSEILPTFVNLHALESRLFNICDILSSSPITNSGISGDIVTKNLSPFSVILGICVDFT